MAKIIIINPLASPSAGAPALKYGDVNTVTPSPGEVKGLIIIELIEINECTRWTNEEQKILNFIYIYIRD